LDSGFRHPSLTANLATADPFNVAKSNKKVLHPSTHVGFPHHSPDETAIRRGLIAELCLVRCLLLIRIAKFLQGVQAFENLPYRQETTEFGGFRVDWSHGWNKLVNSRLFALKSRLSTEFDRSLPREGFGYVTLSMVWLAGRWMGGSRRRSCDGP
jgi:hypothetical protein